MIRVIELHSLIYKHLLFSGILKKPIPRFIQMSALQASTNAPSKYLRSKGKAEELLAEISDDLKNLQPPDSLIDGSLWFGGFSHELLHSMGYLMNPFDISPLDIYQVPVELTQEYDMLSNGNWNESKINDSFLSNLAMTIKGNIKLIFLNQTGTVRQFQKSRFSKLAHFYWVKLLPIRNRIRKFSG